MKRYHGDYRATTREPFVVVEEDGVVTPLYLNCFYSDTVRWGHSGGPEALQLAFAICFDALGGDLARVTNVLRAFKYNVIANLNEDEGWTLTQAEVLARIQVLESALAEVRVAPSGSKVAPF